jgi:hypothetical protein
MKGKKMEDKKLYRKKGRKYVEVGPEFTGWPCDGFWLVTDSGRKSMFTSYLGESQCPGNILALAKYEDILSKKYLELKEGGLYSAHDVAMLMIKTLSEQLWIDEVCRKDQHNW